MLCLKYSLLQIYQKTAHRKVEGTRGDFIIKKKKAKNLLNLVDLAMEGF